MVNVPPLPPLLSSTPPPIDFGEDDEDVDVLSPPDDAESDFGGFLTDDDTKTIEHLPVSIYDGLIPPEEVDITNYVVAAALPQTDVTINEDFKNNIKSLHLTEAFNFNIKNTNDDSTNVESKSTEYIHKIKETENLYNPVDTLETESSICASNCPTLCSKSKNVKDLTIESSSAETRRISSKTDITDMHNMVSVEDIVDDLSDDELYSPKVTKNFVETDNQSFDYFKIEEINSAGNEKKLDSNVADSESLQFLDNNESVSLEIENDNDFKSFSSNSIIQNRFDMPSPLQDDSNSIDEDDDFGDFADFQETHFVNDTVPANDTNIKQHNDLEPAHVNGFNKRNTIKNCTSTANKYINESEHVSPSKELNDSTSEISTVSDDCEISNDTKDNSCSDNTNIKSIEHLQKPIECCKEISSDGDEFDDFANFESHQDATKLDQKNSSSHEVIDNVDNEDDFGDFNTAEPITPAGCGVPVNETSQNTISETSVLPPKNLNERISKILQLMFTPVINLPAESSGELKTNKMQDIPFTSIDTAKALEYQWMVSDTRHSFIRSLGIDSRNILFGDNWNPSLPRFAANLSFNPLKPMKPVQPPSNTDYSNSMLETLPVSSSKTNEILEICNEKMESQDLKSAAERTAEALKDIAVPPSVNPNAKTSMPCLSNIPPTTENVSLTILENTLDNEDKVSKTPPISEMESITTFSSPLPATAMNIELSNSQIAKNVVAFELNEVEENLKSTLNINEVVVTSTFTGSFKESHIYTPPNTNDFVMKHASTTPSTSVSASSSSPSPTKASPIDFDYEKAAMGVIIDETVVKKEYRDVEYNPPFTMESLNKSTISKLDVFETSSYTNTNANILCSSDIKVSTNDIAQEDEQSNESNDDFSEFQSVSSEVAVPAATAIPKNSRPLEAPKNTTISHGGMILSPAILIPQAISMENQKPKIEWGDSTASINPEELARIEELFPEPKSLKSSNSSQKSTPTHQMSSTPSISATVANKELEGNTNSINDDDDDDWSEFVSVTVTNNTSTNRSGGNNNISAKSPNSSPFNQRSPAISHKMPPTTPNSNYDDEWSEFVSSAPPSQQPSGYRVPQFNSGAWQNANFYNNPLSMYHKGPLNITKTAATTHSAQKSLYNNNNNSQQPYQIANNLPIVVPGMNQPKRNSSYKQQIHVMQNFSTAPVPTPERISASAPASALSSASASASKTNQFQSIGSAKVAPSIALIPDLGFVAPAIPTHTSFINSLPKPSINMKK